MNALDEKSNCQSSASNRIEGLDLARAIAILGMVIINYDNAIVSDIREFTLLETIVMGLQGKAVPVFIVLSGIGLSLMAKSFFSKAGVNQLSDFRLILIKRSLFLFVIGLFLKQLWPADILHYYGIYLLAGAVLIAVSNRVLWACIAVFILVSVIYMVGFDIYAELDWDKIAFPDFQSAYELLRHLFFLGFYPVFPWFSLFVFGMWLGRLDMSGRHCRISMIFLGIFLVVLAEFASNRLLNSLITYAYEKDKFSLLFLSDIELFPATPLYILSGSGIALAMIGLSLAVAEKFSTHRCVELLTAVGRISLTLYVAHIAIGINALDLIGKGFDQTVSFAVLNAIGFFGAAVVLSHYLKKEGRKGPLEWIMRYLSKPFKISIRYPKKMPEKRIP